MEVAAAAAVVLGVGVGVVVVVAVAVVVVLLLLLVVAAVAVAVVVVEVEAEAEAVGVVVIESVFHIGICCGVTGFGYGSGMERVWIGVWIGTRYLGRLSRYGCEGRERGISSLV
jgi:hypothetical protein